MEKNKPCISCKKSSNLQIKDKHYCNRCFTRVIEKRIRKYIRLNQFFKKDDIIQINDSLTKEILNNSIKNLPVTFKEDKIKNNPSSKIKNNSRYKIVIPWTLEDEICEFLKGFLESKIILKNLGPKIKDQIKLLRPVEEEELEHYAKIKKIKFNKRKSDYITAFLDKLQQKYPDVRFSLLHSVDKLIGAIN